MKKAKINFEVDAQNLAHAQAYAALHRVSLNKLVSAYFGSLGQHEALPMLDTSQKVLLDVSLGRLSLVDAAHELGLPDGGYVLQMMRDARLPLPGLPPALVKSQMDAARQALIECLIPQAPTKKQATQKTPRRGAKTPAAHG